MAKEFDIYLNKRLTECDIIVYSIPYRDGISAAHRLILESCVESYTFYKFVAAQTGSCLVQHIDEMLKTCYERLSNGVGLGFSAAVDTYYAIDPEEAGVELSAEQVDTLSTMFTSAENKVSIAAWPLTAYVGKSGGNAMSAIHFAINLQQETKKSILSVEPGIVVGSNVTGTNKISKLDIGAPIKTDAMLVNLCYRIYNMANTGVALAADVLGTELHYSLGNGQSGIIFGQDVKGGDIAFKCERLDNIVSILSEATESIQQLMHPKRAAVSFEFVSNYILKRHRLLSEMDSGDIAAYDDMTLDDVDYIIL